MSLYKKLNIDFYFNSMLILFALTIIPVLAFSLLITEGYPIYVMFGVAFVLEICIHTLYSILFFFFKKVVKLLT